MSEKTFLGFWPTREEVGEFGPITLNDCSLPDTDSQARCASTLLDFSGPGWKIKVCADYLVLVHLEDLEPALTAERNQLTSNFDFSIEATRAAWPRYVEALNALYFLLFASCFTGRNHSILHDFSELSFWHCTRILYDDDGKRIRQANYGRTSGSYLRRFGQRTCDTAPPALTLDHETFKDMAFYWNIFHDLDLVPLVATAAKVISDHRLPNYRASIVLAWFEVESWIIETADGLGIQTTSIAKKTGDTLTHKITHILKKLLEGTTVKVNFSDINALRVIRNDIAHNNYRPALQDSALAVRCLMYVIKMRSGLNLKVDEGTPPTIGL